MKAEETILPEELGEKGHYGNNGEWVLLAEESLFELPDYPDYAKCDYCGAEVSYDFWVENGGLCEECYQENLIEWKGVK
jgi:hypothetical protein